MRPLLLRMQAFGPFADVQEVDFTQLGERALFLIHGATGAGKTTLLDALCFALYGDTSGGERDPRAMRSDHAAAQLATEVTLEFALGRERLRVVRQPAQRRAKQRGSGFTEAPATAQLDRFDGAGWTSVATQPGKVGAEIEARLGFDSVQFRQVIVLPQGRFRELLTARSDEREAILQTLFRTERYRLLGEALKRRAREVEEEAKANRLRCESLLEQAGAASAEALAAHRGVLQEELAASQARALQARAQLVDARARFEQGREAARALKELAEATLTVEQLRGAQAGIDAQRRELDAGRRAERLRPLDEALQEAVRSLDAAAARQSAALKALDAATTLRAAAAAALAAEAGREPERESARRRQAELEGLVERVSRLAAIEDRRLAAEQGRAKLDATLANLRGELEQRRTRHIEATERLERLRQSAAGAAFLGAQLKALETRRQQLQRLAQSRRDAYTAETALVQARRALREDDALLATARGTLENIERGWLAAQADVLASRLQEGTPCPVCGSVEHPAPAHVRTAGAEPVAEAVVLEKAREAVRRAESEREAALHRVHEADKPVVEARTRVSELEASLGVPSPGEVGSGEVGLGEMGPGEMGPGEPRPGETREGTAVMDADAVAGELEAVRARLGEAEAAAAQLAPTQNALESGAQAIVAAERQVAALEAERLELTTHIATADGEIGLHREAIPEGLRSPVRLQTEIAAATARRTALEAALQCARQGEQDAASGLAAAAAALQSSDAEHARAAAATASARERFAARLAECGFALEADYRDAAREPAALAALEGAIERHQQAAAAAQDRLERARAGAAGVATPDLPALESAFAAAEAALEVALKREQEIAGVIATADRTLAELHRLASLASEVERRYAVLGRLAEVAGGVNPLRMTFQRFVLATLLDEVLEAASLRLIRMSRSRFELRRVRGVLDQRSAGGLELEIFDHYTGTARPANTLSGGEGFLAALSLALGLADVVQSRAGGMQMETLFIDEGFGTLDPESLDYALRTLIDLQQAGRLVGVISHVAELKERMDVRLEVSSGPRGSAIRVVR